MKALCTAAIAVLIMVGMGPSPVESSDKKPAKSAKAQTKPTKQKSGLLGLGDGDLILTCQDLCEILPSCCRKPRN